MSSSEQGRHLRTASELVLSGASLDRWTQVVRWAAEEGCSPGSSDAACFLPIEPAGLAVGRLGGRTVRRSLRHAATGRARTRITTLPPSLSPRSTVPRWRTRPATRATASTADEWEDAYEFGYPGDTHPARRGITGEELRYCIGTTWRPGTWPFQDDQQAIHCDQGGGASGGPLLTDLQPGRGWGYLVGNVSYHPDDNSDEERSPHFGDAAVNLYDEVKDD